MVFAKIPRHTSQNAITEGDLKCILTRNCEGTEQLHFEKNTSQPFYVAVHINNWSGGLILTTNTSVLENLPSDTHPLPK